MRRIPDEDVWKNIRKERGCWLWQGRVNNKGYGKIGDRYVHVVAWVLTHGSIPEGLEVDHLCRRITCVNPKHLQVVSRDENNRRTRILVKGACKRGHTIKSERDLYVRPDGTGTSCRECNNERARRYRAPARQL